MGDAFIVRRGGIADAFAGISVEYPQGSVCTCTNGTKTLTAKDTSGSFLFLIPEAGTWTVSCTDGTRTKSENVTISEQYQAEEIVLIYALELIVDGVVKQEFTSHNATATYNSANHTLDVRPDGSYWGNQEAYHSVLVDLTYYSFLKIKCRNSGSTTSVHAQIVGGATYNDTTILQNISTTMDTLTVDVSALTGNKYISINASSYLYNYDTGEKHVATAAIEDMWLE